MSTTETPTLDQYAKLQADVSRISRLISEATQGHDDTRRAAEAAQQAIADYHASVGTGQRDADPEAEAALVAEYQRLAARLRARPNGQGTYDIAVQAKVDQLTKQRSAAEQAVRTFIAEHRKQITAEMSAKADVVAAEMTSAKAAVNAAYRSWIRLGGDWNPFVRVWGTDPKMPRCPIESARDQLKPVGTDDLRRLHYDQSMRCIPLEIVREQQRAEQEAAERAKYAAR